MSDRYPPLRRRSARLRGDAGFTLVELLVAVVVTGIVVASLAGLTIAIFRQQSGTNSRLDLARAEQTLNMSLPNDLASATTVEVDPALTPCESACPVPEAVAGSNAAMMSWTTVESAGPPKVERKTNVSYRYMAVGLHYAIMRVQCDRVDGAAWSCSHRIVLNDAPPPVGEFIPGVTPPTWAMEVTDPPVACKVDDCLSDPVLDTGTAKGAHRVKVTVRDTSGVVSSSTTYSPVSLTAGSTESTGHLDPDGLDGAPDFTEVRSRCGGNIAVAFDASGSIGDVNKPYVLSGISALVTELAGTPVRFQVVRFNVGAMTLGVSGKDWKVEQWTPHWFDMLVPADVDQLIALLSDPVLNKFSGGTNWEDALFRSFKNQDGTDQQTTPDMFLFFTDGVPTHDRLTFGRFFVAPKFEDFGLRFNSANPNTADPVAGQDAALGRPKDPALPSEAITAAEIQQAFKGFEEYMPPLPNPDYGAIDGRPDPAKGKYVQETWDRANYIAEQFRNGRTRFIGVGVGNLFAKNEGGTWSYDKSDWVTVEDGKRVTTPTENRTILARLISGSDTGVPAIEENGEYINAATANMYTLPEWSKFGQAMQSIALSQCGGTLTVQTLLGGEPAGDEFQYQTTSVLDSDGQPVPASSTVVKTSAQFPSGTFDLSIPKGDYVDVTIEPLNFSNIGMYEPAGSPSWSCSAKRAALPVTEVPIVGETWTSVTVRVPADAAVSCRLNVIESNP